MGLNDRWTLDDITDHILVDSLKKLEVIKDIVISKKNYNCHKMELFVAKYGKSLKVVRFRLYHMSSDNLKKFFTLISRFESLESLGIVISSTKTNVESIDEYI